MNNLFKKTVSEPTVLKSLRARLNPNCFPRMTPVMSAVVGFIVGAPFGDPLIAEIQIVYDGAVVARPIGTVKTQIIGCYDDLVRNWKGYWLALDSLRRNGSRLIACSQPKSATSSRPTTRS